MSDLLSRLFSNLDIAVLERQAAGTYTLLSEAPAWLCPLWPDACRNRKELRPEDTFLFLEDFLDRHAGFWQRPSATPITSGVWTETGPDGKDHLLQAIALYVDDHPLLLLRIPPQQETWSIYQQAREQRLENEQMIEEINKREILLHCIVHDLSNPLSGIKGSLELLEDADDLTPDEAQQLVHLGLRQVRKMRQLIQSILSTFANDVKTLVPTLIGEDVAPDLGACIQDVAQSFSATASVKGVRIDVDLPESDRPFKVVGESERLERVLFNLLVNAIRHTPEGRRIVLKVREEERFVLASVEDEGAGVPDEIVDRLFDRFSQGPGETGQTGLGLYFCRITVEHWGGTIGYTPSESGGARFWIRLPRPVTFQPSEFGVHSSEFRVLSSEFRVRSA